MIADQKVDFSICSCTKDEEVFFFLNDLLPSAFASICSSLIVYGLFNFSTENTQIDKLEGFSNYSCLLCFYTFEIVERDNHRRGKSCQRRWNNSSSCIACVIYRVKMIKIKPASAPGVFITGPRVAHGPQVYHPWRC